MGRAFIAVALFACLLGAAYGAGMVQLSSVTYPNATGEDFVWAWEHPTTGVTYMMYTNRIGTIPSGQPLDGTQTTTYQYNTDWGSGSCLDSARRVCGRDTTAVPILFGANNYLFATFFYHHDDNDDAYGLRGWDTSIYQVARYGGSCSSEQATVYYSGGLGIRAAYWQPNFPSGAYGTAWVATDNFYTASIVRFIYTSTTDFASWAPATTDYRPPERSCYGGNTCSLYRPTGATTEFDGHVIFGMSTGKIVYFPSDMQSGTPVGVEKGVIAGDIISIAGYSLADGQKYLLIGTSLGILVQYNWSTKSLANLLVVTLGPTTQTISYIQVDTSSAYGPVAYFATSTYDHTNNPNVTVSRVNLADPTVFEVFDSINLNGYAMIKFFKLYPASNYLVVGASASTFTNYPTFIRIQMSTCPTDCESCVSDPYYCGYCTGNDQCRRQSDCTNTWLAPAMCPTVGSITPTTGAHAGGTSVTFVGTNFVTGGPLNQYTCTFGGSAPQTATSVTSTNVICTSPSSVSVGAATAVLSYQNRALPAQQSFDYYSCNTLACADCSSKSECTMCFRQGGCRAATNCTGAQARNVCPNTLTTDPLTLPVNSAPTTVTLHPSNLYQGEDYYCDFGNGTIVSAVISGANVICQNVASAFSGIRHPEVMIKDTNGIPVSYAPSTQSNTFEFYDCHEISACKTCGTGHPNCKFCSDATPYKCLYQSENCVGGVTEVDSCATILDNYPQPSTLHTSEAGTTVTLSLAGLALGGTLVQCQWTPPTGAVVLTSISGSAPTYTCATPAPLDTVGTWQVAITVDGAVATNSRPFVVYDCLGDRCSACVTTAKPLCKWCPLSTSCSASTCTQEVNAVANCPSASFPPAQDTLAGQSTFSFNVTVVPTPAANFQCSFEGVGVANISVSGNTVSCIVPSTNVTKFVPFSVTGPGGNYFLPPVPFEYYDCDFKPTLGPNGEQEPRLCDNCFTLPGCTWCTTSCQATATCPAGDSNCPTLNTVTPNTIEAGVSTPVTIITNNVPPQQLSCIFAGSDPVPAIVSGTTVSCLSPIRTSSGVTTLQLFDTERAVPWALGTLQVTFYVCSPSTRCSDSCYSNPNCGWCADEGKCTGQYGCQGQNPDNFWLNQTCPAVSSISPDFIQIVPANSNFTKSGPAETVTATLTGISFPSVQNKRALTSDFKCGFQDVEVDAASFDPVTNVLTCPIATLTRQRVIDFFVKYKGNILNGNDIEFEGVNCFAIGVCAVCNFNPRCGWCRGATSCMTPAWCGAQPVTLWTQASCPRISEFRPALAGTAGGETVTVIGNDFFNSPNFYFLISGETDPIPATYVSDTELTFTTPARSTEGQVQMLLTLNGTAYITDTTGLTFSAQSGVSIPVTAGVSVAAALVAIGAIVALLVMKKRNVGFFAGFKLVEPDYNVVAYGNFLQPLYRFPKDKYNALEIKIMSNRYFVTTIVDTTASTEQDAIARALVFLFEHHGKTTELLIFHIDREVHLCIAENTIFRTNSMASKFFKFYSKIVGIKFIFYTLARFIMELERISAVGKSDGKPAVDSQASSKSLLSMEMEVDPSKQGDASFADSEANLYQLILTCQKIFSNIRDGMARMPREFIQVFRALEYSINTKFGNEDAVYKAVGGFLFLRFIGPAITAPHAYGLLEKPPNPVCQRQLVLIGKVTQGLANLVLPGAKETFMLQLTDFIQRNIPKMRQYYREVLNLDPNSRPATEIVAKSDNVRYNALAVLITQILTFDKKMIEHFPKVSQDSADVLKELNSIMDEVAYSYKIPRKAGAAGGKEDKDD